MPPHGLGFASHAGGTSLAWAQARAAPNILGEPLSHHDTLPNFASPGHLHPEACRPLIKEVSKDSLPLAPPVGGRSALPCRHSGSSLAMSSVSSFLAVGIRHPMVTLDFSGDSACTLSWNSLVKAFHGHH